MLKICPDLVEVQDIQFKLHCRLQVFDSPIQGTSRKLNLISCASRYGLLFIGSHLPNLQVIQLKCVENYNPKDKDISNYPRRNVALPSSASHVCVNCDCTVLAVVIDKDKCPTVIFYDVPSFYKENIRVIKEIRLSATPGMIISEIGWNPTLPAIFTACKSDGSLGVYEVKGDTVDINEIPAAAEASCFCWSPKGKQLAVGSKRGQITQYKPDLKAVKVTNAPPLEGLHQLLSLQWISSYQFVGVYQPHRADGQAKLIVVDAPKTGDTTYTDYDDVCYSGASRTPQFFMMFLQQWNLLLVASSNSSELAALGYISDAWKQYIIGDAARAELPLNNGDDTFPVGLSLDISNTRPLPWGESSILPCPYVLMLSHAGLLCLFNLVNLKEGMPTICTPPDLVQDLSGLRYFVAESEKGPQPKDQSEQVPATASAPPVSSQPLFGSLATNQTSTQPLNFSQPTATQASLYGKSPASFVDTSKLDQPSIFTGQTTVLSGAQPLFGQTDTVKSLPGAPVQALNLTSAATTTGITKPSLFAPTPVVATANTTPSVHGITQTASPAAISFGTKSTTASSLFGGQTTITTAKPPAVPSTSDKYGAILSALNNPPAAVPAAQNRPIILRTSKPEPKAQVKPPVAVIPSIPPASQEPNSADNVSSTMIRRECAALEAELKGLLQQGRSINVNIGTENEKTYITEKITDLQEFIKEIDDVIRDEQDEVHALKGDLILSWAQYEEAQSHYNVSKDQLEALLTKSQPLDTATEKRQANMRKLMYYIESQLTQASKALDEQWDSFQDYAKKTFRVQTPTMESIYQTMVRMNAIMQKQNYIIKDASNSLKRRPKNTKGPCLLLSLENTTGIEESLEKLQIDEDTAKRHLYEKALKQAQALTKTKTEKLKSFLTNREVSHVTALKPELSASILQTPPYRKLEAVSILGSHLTPIEKPGVARSLDFIQSTPVHKSASVDLIKVPPNTPVQVEPQKTFAFKSAELGISTLNQASSTSMSAPVSKPSAFVPASQGTNTFNFSAANTNVQTSKTTALFTFGGNTTVTTTVASKADSTSLSFSKPVSFSTTFSFANAASSTTVTTKPTPVFATPPTKCTILGGGTTSLFGTKVQSNDAKPEVSILPLISKPSPDSSKSMSATTSLNTSATSGFQFGSAAAVSKAFETEKTQIKPTTAPAKVALTQQSSLQPSVASVTATVTQPTMGALLGNTPSATLISTTVTSSSVPHTAIVSPSVSSTTSTFGALPAFGTSTASSPSGTSPLAGFTFKTASPSIFAPASSTTGSIFGSTPTTAQSIFGSTAANATQPLFGSMTSTAATTTTTSIFGASSTTVVGTTAVGTTASSIFGSTTAATTTAQSLFGASTAVTTTAQSIFRAASTTATTTTGQSILGAASTAATTTDHSIFGAATTTAESTTGQSIFGAAATTAATTSQSIFGAAATVTATTSAQSIFGGTPTTASAIFGSTVAATATTSAPSLIGGVSSVPVASSQSIFGSTAAATSTPSVFGGTSVAASVFGSTPTTAATTSAPSVFGAASTAAVTAASPSIFGSTPTSPVTIAQPTFGSTTAASSDQPIFGSTAAATGAFSSSASIFGAQASATTQPGIFGAGTAAKPLFGSTAAVSETGIFGGNATSTSQTSIFGTASPATTSTSVFGGAAPVSTQGSIFGTPVTQNSVFGSSATTQASIFGGTSTSKSSSVFGSPTTTPFGASSPFGQTQSVFGTPATTASAFGSSPFGSSSVFGSAPATTATVFGQPAAFGQNSTSVFGTSTAANSPFGATNSPSTFGTASSTGNVFGQSAASSFSFANTGNTGNTGSFGFGGLNVGNAPTTSSSIFGGSSFGQNTTVANPFSRAADAKPAFGGSGGSIFGGNSASSTASIFGSNTASGFGGAQPSTFGSPGAFGQQSSFGQPSAFGGSSQPGPFSGGGTGVGQSGFGSPGAFQKPASGFGAAPVFGGSPQQGFGAAPSFGGSPAFGSAPAFGSPNKVFGSTTPTAAFGASTTGSPGFGNLANQNTIGFGNLAQQAPTSSAGGFSGNSSFSNWR